MAGKNRPLPYPEVGYPPGFPGAPIANPGNTKPEVGVLPAGSPVGSFSGKPSVYPSPLPSAYNDPMGPFANPKLPQGAMMPADQTSPYANPNFATNQASLKGLGYAMPVQAGLDAASQVTATPRAADATLQAVGAGLSGAAGGAASGAMIGAMGGPVGAAGGAVIGGVVGLVSGGIQAFTGLRAARDNARKQERYQREVLARQDRREAQARADGQEQLRYNRRAAALQSNWAAVQEAGRRMNDVMAEDETLKQLFFRDGR